MWCWSHDKNGRHLWLNPIIVCWNDYLGLILTYYITWSNFATKAFIYENLAMMDSLEIVAACDLQVGCFSKLNEEMRSSRFPRPKSTQISKYKLVGHLLSDFVSFVLTLPWYQGAFLQDHWSSGFYFGLACRGFDFICMSCWSLFIFYL